MKSQGVHHSRLAGASRRIVHWLALGAPLNASSAVVIARIVALIAVITWPVAAALGACSWPVGVTLGILSAGMAVWTLRVPALEHYAAPILLLSFLAMSIASIVSGSEEHRAVLLAMLLSSMSIMAGLLLRPAVLFPCMLVAGGALGLALRQTHDSSGLSPGALVLLVAFLLGTTSSIVVWVAGASGSIDPETGLANHRGLTEMLQHRNGTTDTIVVTVNLVGVEHVRRALGPVATQDLVTRVANDIANIVDGRSALGRTGDDEIVIILSGLEKAAAVIDDESRTLVDQVFSAIGTGDYVVEQISVTIGAHVGLALASMAEHVHQPFFAPELLHRSAFAARSARDQGERSVRWTRDPAALSEDDLALLADLKDAMRDDELELVYQPQVRASDGVIVTVEALLRWQSHTHGVVPPDRCIPLAERTGLIGRLTDWVLAEALDAQVRWRNGLDGDACPRVAINVSPLSLRSPEFGGRVVAALRERGLEPSALMLEVTESTAIDVPDAVSRLAPLRDHGVRIAIDDFGTGFTSLAALPLLPLDELKVDQSFVRDSATSEASAAIVRSVCELAHRIGLIAVAEGVDNEELAERMIEFGFDLLQGHHFAHPLSEQELLDQL